VQFLQMDCNNFIGPERKKYLESHDAKTLLEYLDLWLPHFPSILHLAILFQISEIVIEFYITYRKDQINFTCCTRCCKTDDLLLTSSC
jgi:hypothetical protein